MSVVTRLPNQRDLLDALREGRMTTSEWLKLSRLKGKELQDDLAHPRIAPPPIRTRTSV